MARRQDRRREGLIDRKKDARAGTGFCRGGNTKSVDCKGL